MKKLLFFLLLIPGIATAQPIYNLKQCLETGLERNYEIRIIKNTQQISDNNATAGNAGYLPNIGFSSDYSGALNNMIQQYPVGGDKLTYNNILNQTFNAGIYVNWTIFDGLSIQTNHKRLNELKKIGELNTRLTIENYIAELSAEYYNYVRQNIQLNNLSYAVTLSKERLRIVEERYNIGSMSRLDLQQAKVDFNADSSRLIRQKEMLFFSRVRLNQLMGLENVEEHTATTDTLIILNENKLVEKEDAWQNVLGQNIFLTLSEKNIYLSELDLKSIESVNYPYLRLNTGYGYTYNGYQMGSIQKQNTLGLTYGVTLGITIFDGMNRSRQQKNARIEIENRKLAHDNVFLSLKSDFSNIWMAYENNRGLMQLEEENLKTAEDNYGIAIDRYKLGDLSGIELREAQNSLLEAEERLVQAQYNTKLCEISLLQISGKITTLLN